MENANKWEDELKILKNIISKMPLEMSIKWGAEVFTFNGKNVVSFGGFKNYFTLWFYNGVFLKDDYSVLVNGQEGKTKSLRQWRFTDKSEIDEKKILEYLQEAIEIEKKGLKISPEKMKPLPIIPEILLMELNKDDTFKKSFEKLTVGKQKEYILYIEEAKLDKTKLTRLAKIKPMILENIGLNDKYK